MDVSLICPCYNSLSSLPRLLSSFQKQDFAGTKEILFIVDPSHDGTEDYLLGLQSDEVKVIINLERLGVVPCRNLGIEKSRGKYIGFADADDYLDESYLSKMIASMEKENADACDCSFYVKDEKKEFPYPFRGRTKTVSGLQAVRALLWDTSVRGFLWSKLFKRDVLLRNPRVSLPENLLFEDMPFCFMAFSKCEKVILLNDPLYHYSKEDGSSLTNRKNPNRAKQHLASFSFMKDYAERFGDEELRKAFLSSKFRASLSLDYDLSLSKKDGLSKEDAKKVKRDFYSLYKKGFRNES